MNPINPKLQVLYQWEFEETESFIYVFITVPEVLNPDLIQMDLENNEDLRCFVKGEFPFLAGKLVHPIDSSIQKDITKDGRLKLTMKKKEKTEWGRLFSGQTTSGLIDPCGATKLAMEYLIQGSEAEFTEFLNVAIVLGYIPAIVFRVHQLSEVESEEAHEEIMRLLMIATEVYDSPEGHQLRGVMAIKNKDILCAEREFSIAAKAGITTAKVCLAEMYSPVEEPITGLEDGAKAFALIDEVRQDYPDHIFALYNMAKFYFHGVGVPKDVKKSIEFYKRALSFDTENQIPRIPELEQLYVNGVEEEEEKMSVPGKSLGKAALFVAGAMAAGYLIFKTIKRRGGNQ